MSSQSSISPADDSLQSYICITCGTQYPASAEPPAGCPICQDDRQYVRAGGQQWTTLDKMRGHYHNTFTEIEPGVIAIQTEPRFAIGQQAFLIQTPQGNVLWDMLTYLDETTVAEIERLGGVGAISISHCHYYATMNDWSRAFGDAPIHLHASNRPWVMEPSDSEQAVKYFDSDSLELAPGLTVIRCGGHFPGATCLHWQDGAEGRGLLFSGDTIQVVSTGQWVTFMYSYPNSIPLDPATVRGIVDAVEPYPYERVYGAFGRYVLEDGKGTVQRSSERYIEHVTNPDSNAH